ncbi:MAG: c-type cytochrome [Betaproteobacteria bacterium]|nr:c-type cytochrome [Betaproteobacteria bacterium]MDH5341549.1 c-type cytochrome [Betaproteobacteria bacterium]
MSEHKTPEHTSLIKTPQQLIIVVLLSFIVPVLVIVMLAQLAVDGHKNKPADTAAAEEAIAKRIKPAGEVVVAAAGASQEVRNGKAVYESVCAACHATGVLNAPKLGDKAVWSKLIAEGQAKITADGMKGVRQMPPRGGSPDLSDVEFARAVAYMANQAGANWKEPEARSPAKSEMTGGKIVEIQCSKCHATGVGGAPKIGDRAAWLSRGKQGIDALTLAAIRGHDNMPARGGMAQLTDAEFRSAVLFLFNQVEPAAEGATKATMPAAPLAATSGDAAKGKSVYDASCAACHAAGVAGAPKTGDKTAWASRLKTGKDAMYASAIKGKGAMPPKGGNAGLSDADVKAAVDYLTGLVK